MSRKASGSKHTGFIIAGLCTACVGMLFVAITASSNTKAYLPPKVAQKYFEEWLFDAVAPRIAGIRLQHQSAIEELYMETDFQPLWIDNYEITSAGDALLQSIKETASDRWRIYNYHVSKLAKELQDMKNLPRRATAIDILLSDAFFSYAANSLSKDLLPNLEEDDHPPLIQVANAELSPNQVSSSELVALLAQSFKHGELVRLIKELAPAHQGYLQLREQLDYYSGLENQDWPEFPIGMRLKAGMHHPHVKELRRRLQIFGDYEKGKLAWLLNQGKQALNESRSTRNGFIDEEFYFDESLKNALISFQQRFDLPADGQLDDATRAKLSITPKQIVNQISLNMKRWRHLPKDLGDRYILVNMADYRLEVVEQGDTVMDMKVIIGNINRRTPILAETMNTVVLAPHWNVPPRIAQRDLAPKIMADPNYLAENHYEVVEGWTEPAKIIEPEQVNWQRFARGKTAYRLRQTPGSHNSLGHVKFVLPNNKAIYLHDTSHRELFSEHKRALSSGCIRVEKPLELAELLLRDQRWTDQTIDRILNEGRTTHVALAKPVPVYLMYWTTWVDELGRLQFRDDVYRRDDLDSRKYESITL